MLDGLSRPFESTMVPKQSFVTFTIGIVATHIYPCQNYPVLRYLLCTGKLPVEQSGTEFLWGWGDDPHQDFEIYIKYIFLILIVFIFILLSKNNYIFILLEFICICIII